MAKAAIARSSSVHQGRGRASRRACCSRTAAGMARGSKAMLGISLAVPPCMGERAGGKGLPVFTYRQKGEVDKEMGAGVWGVSSCGAGGKRGDGRSRWRCASDKTAGISHAKNQSGPKVGSKNLRAAGERNYVLRQPVYSPAGRCLVGEGVVAGGVDRGDRVGAARAAVDPADGGG